MKLRSQHAATVLTVLYTGCAWADPIPVGAAESPLEWIALLAETLVVALVLRRYAFKVYHILWAWFTVTLATYVVCWSVLFPVLELLEEYAGRVFLPALVMLLVALECGVVLGEAWIMRHMCTRRFFRHTTTAPFTWKNALLVSLLGNAASLLVPVAFVLWALL